MAGQFDVASTKKLVTLVGKTAQVYKLVSSDGKVDLNDLPHLFLLMPALQSLPDFSVIPKELGDLEAADVADLLAHVGGELGVVEPKVRLIVEKSLITLAAVVELIGAIKA